MPITAPFNLALYRRNRAYIDDYTVNGESYTLEQLLNYLSENLGGEGTNDVTEGTGDPSGDPGSGPQIYQNTTNGQLWVWNGTTWVLIGPQPQLPVYDNEAAALADGLTTGDRWKYSRTNTDGMPAGVVVEQD
jgi:hypothetical protein